MSTFATVCTFIVMVFIYRAHISFNKVRCMGVTFPKAAPRGIVSPWLRSPSLRSPSFSALHDP